VTVQVTTGKPVCCSPVDKLTHRAGFRGRHGTCDDGAMTFRISRACTVLCIAASLAVSTPASAQEKVNAPEPNDPLLVPVPRPARRIVEWADIATNLRGRSIDLALALAQVQRAEAETRGALAALYGTIGVQGQSSLNLITRETTQVVGIDGTGAPITESFISPTRRVIHGAGATATLPIVAPRAWNAIRTANVNVGLAEEILADTRRIIVEKAASSVVAVVAAERIAEVNRAGLRSALERSALAKRRTAIGGGTNLDVVRADQDLEAARALIVTGDESLRQARESLGLALGWPEQVGVEPSLRLDTIVTDAGRQCHRLADVDQRPDIVAARTRVELAEQVRRDATYGFLPTLSAESQAATTSADVSPTQFPTVWTVQGLLAWNLWDGGARYAQLERGAALRRTAEANLEGARRDLGIAVKRADRAVDVASASRDIALRARDLTIEQERLTRVAFTAGTGTSLELVTAAAQLRAQEVQLTLREYDLVRARLLALLVRAKCDF
jgi:outer membrane protein, multidrug efflux system